MDRQSLQGGVGISENSNSESKRSPIPGQIAKMIPPLDRSQGLPPSPPLPQVPPQSDQNQRRKAFQLNKSVDHIVLKDEPFEVGGQKLTIDEILKKIHSKAPPPAASPRIEERDLGSDNGGARAEVRARIPQPATYYGVRIVRPGENLWNIDYAIVREYFARRHIILPVAADEPAPDGRSSGIGRLLQFLQGVVYVYNLQENRLETNLNVIHPSAMVVFFNISDLFTALDHLNPTDLHQLRYVKDSLRLETSGLNKELLDRQALRD